MLDRIPMGAREDRPSLHAISVPFLLFSVVYLNSDSGVSLSVQYMFIFYSANSHIFDEVFQFALLDCIRVRSPYRSAGKV